MKTTPYSEGSKKASICVVAEAPARNEMIIGRPLVGEAGKLFNQFLTAAGLQRSDLYIANCSRVPVKDAPKAWLNKEFLTKEGQEVRDDLANRLRDVEANVIVTLGAPATKMLVDDHRIMKVRGSPLESTLLPGREVIPTPHPASCLPWRQYTNRYLIINDLDKARRHSYYSGIRYPKRQMVIDPTFEEVIAYLDKCLEYPRLAFDIETLNNQVSCISFAVSPWDGICIPIHERWSFQQELEIWEKIRVVLETPGITKIGSGICTFDIPFLWMQNRILVAGPYFDTVVVHKILYPDFKAGLEFLCSMYTDEPYYKDDIKKWTKGAIKDIETFWLYNAKDSTCVFECADALQVELDEDPEFAWMVRDTMAVFEPVLYLGQHGLSIDTKRLNETKKTLQKELDEVEKELFDIVGFELNVNSAPQMKKYFYETKKVRPYKSRATGRPTLDDKALSRIVRRDNLPEARLCQRVRNLRKLQSTYIEVGLDKDERLRCVYDIRGTTTSRLSSKKTPVDTGMNHQNLDPRFRGFIIPEPPPELR